MDVSSVDMNLCTCGIKVLVFELSYFSSVKGIGVVCSEFFYIKFGNAPSYLLIGSKTYLYLSVFDIGMIHDIFRCIHYFSYTGLVVCTKQCGSVCCNKCLTLIVKHFRKIYSIKHNVLGFV